MSSNRLKYKPYCNQVKFSKEANLSKRMLFNFVDDVIREYGKPRDNTYYLFVQELPQSVKRIFLSHLDTEGEYEYLISNPIREVEAFKEYQDIMQSYINERIDDVYREDMEEMGYHLRHYPDNNDIYYQR